jgi:hypothetical protein
MLHCSAKRAALSVAAVVLALVGHAIPARAQAAERALYVSVLDEKGAPVAEVTPADLVVREDGVSREILRVTPATEPMQVAVLVDTSTPLSADLSNVREGLTAFVAKMAPAHELSIVEYGERPSILADSTTDVSALEKGIGRIFPRKGSGAYVLDALVETARGIQKRESPRPVIVAVDTEGVEFGNHDHQRVLDALEASGAALYVMNLSIGGTAGDLVSHEIRNRSIVFDRGTRESGGYRENLLSSLALKQALEKLADDLLHQVKVVYARPQALIPPDRVTVEAVRAGLTARGTPVKPVKGV